MDITTRTIRYYEDEGLLSPKRRGQQRVYTASHRVKLKLVLRGKRLGLSLAQSKEIIKMHAPNTNNKAQLEKLLEVLQLRKSQLNDQLKDIELMLIDIKSAEKTLRKQ